jgi:nodulation protein E
MTRRVAITGLGALSALGANVADHLAGLKAGTVGIGEARHVNTEGLKTKVYAEVHDFDPEAHFDQRQLGLMDRSAQLAVVTAREALKDAGPALEGLPLEKAGAIFSAAIGYSTMEEGYHRLLVAKAARPHPFTVPRAMPNGPVANITMDLGIHGPAFAIASACSSGAHSIGVAFQMVRSGMLDVALAGGSEAPLTFGMMKSWEALRVLSSDACRPFSKDRSGLVLGEGAAAVVLEDYERALARGATIHAELTGFGMSADGLDMTAPDAASAARSVEFALKDAGIAPSDVDYVNAHGTATPLNDRTETVTLRSVFGNPVGGISMSSTKSAIGHLLGGAGAVESIFCLLAMRDGVVPPTLNLDDPVDGADGVDLVPNTARRRTVDIALNNSFGFGGTNATLVFNRLDA